MTRTPSIIEYMAALGDPAAKRAVEVKAQLEPDDDILFDRDPPEPTPCECKITHLETCPLFMAEPEISDDLLDDFDHAEEYGEWPELEPRRGHPDDEGTYQ